MPIAQLSSLPLPRRVVTLIARCHHLFETVRHPYRPELHYMRGPAPKWHARHGLAARI